MKKTHRPSLKRFNSKGFTLAEVIVSMAITAILMVGISAFFSSTFSTIFRVQNESVKTEKQFVVNEIIRNKFIKIKTLIELGAQNDSVLLLNKSDGKQLPFSYMAKNVNKLVFKDFLVFSKFLINSNKHLFANSGDGGVDIATGSIANPLVPTDKFKNFSSFAITDNGDRYFVAMPHQNTVLDCECNPMCNTCSDLLPVGTLDTPTDIELAELNTNEEYLFISDSGNGRVLRYQLTAPNELKTVASPLKYPTGLSYYENGSEQWLFIADTLADTVLKVNAKNPTSLTTIAGKGTDKDCNNVSSKFCEFNMPTGVFASHSDTHNDTLHISDSGNNRILRIEDPGIPDKILFDFTPNENYKLDRIEISGGSFAGGVFNEAENTLIGDSNHYKNTSNTFKNSGRLTVYSDNTVREETSPNTCETDIANKSFYVNEFPQNIGINNGDKIFHGNRELTIATYSQNAVECRLSKADPSLGKYKITVNESIAIDLQKKYNPPQHGEIIYPGTPDNIKIQIDNDENSPITIDSGFQNLELKIYDIDQGLVHTENLSIRMGDGIIGLEEDTIWVVRSNLNFPTGLTNSYFVNSGNRTINRIIDGNPTGITVNPIDTDSFENYDYVSDFDLASEDGLVFSQYNGTKILELELKAQIDSETTQTYMLNASIGQ